MSVEQEYHIASVKPDFLTHTVELTWANGAVTKSDFKHMVGRGVFERFSDPEFFNKVTMVEGGQFLTWPNGIEYSAESLWFYAHPKNPPDVRGTSSSTPKSWVAYHPKPV